MESDVVIIGGGLAGLTAAILLSRSGLEVRVVEKSHYPRHKVCGEYVSNEVRPLLTHLQLDLKALSAVDIDTFALSNVQGKKIETALPLGGFGVSRHALDEALYQIAVGQGVQFCFEPVHKVDFKNDRFSVCSPSKTFSSKIALAAFGKRSQLDIRLERPFMHQNSPWIGVKCHYDFPEFPENKVALHCFPGGYGGLSKTERGHVNFCYLASYQSFKQAGGIKAYNASVVALNPFLREFLGNARPLFKKPLSIAQISFARKSTVTNHLLCCGDSAGLIHPLCGNGMAMAIHSGKIAADKVLGYFEGTHDRLTMEREYEVQWRATFGRRLWFGWQLQQLLLRPNLSRSLFSTIPLSKRFMGSIIRQTHGKPILV